MVKEVVVKKNIKKLPVKIIKRTPIKTVKKTGNVEDILIENFVALQKVMTNLSLKFDNLASQISKLLELFEISAKSIAEKGYDSGKGGGEMVEKLDNLLEQNKVIARGLTLLHDSNPSQIPQSHEIPPLQPPLPRRLLPKNPIPPQSTQGQRPPARANEYQRSISSNPENREN